MTLAIVLTIVAFGLVVLEVAVPSFGLLSLLAATAYTFALILAFRTGSTPGWTLVGTGILLFPTALVLGLHVLPRTPIGRRLFLFAPRREEVRARVQPEEVKALVGAEAVALTDLRPSGTAVANGRRLDVVTNGVFVAKGSPVRIAAVEGYRIVVVPVSPPSLQEQS